MYMKMSNVKIFKDRKNEEQLIYQNSKTISRSVLTVQMLPTNICTIYSNRQHFMIFCQVASKAVQTTHAVNPLIM